MNHLCRIMLGLALMSAQARAADIELTLVANSPTGGPGDKLWRMFEENIAAKAGTRIEVKKLVHGELGGDDVGFQAIRKGRGQMGIAGENGFAQAIPEASVLNLPFLFSSVEECDFIFDNICGDGLGNYAILAWRFITICSWCNYRFSPKQFIEFNSAYSVANFSSNNWRQYKLFYW